MKIKIFRGVSKRKFTWLVEVFQWARNKFKRFSFSKYFLVLCCYGQKRLHHVRHNLRKITARTLHTRDILMKSSITPHLNRNYLGKPIIGGYAFCKPVGNQATHPEHVITVTNS